MILSLPLCRAAEPGVFLQGPHVSEYFGDEARE
jgi:hypothetical protein